MKENIIKWYQHPHKDLKNPVFAKQILKPGAFTGAHKEAAAGAQNKKNFTAQMQISFKEARETNYGLRLLKERETVPAQTIITYFSNRNECIIF